MKNWPSGKDPDARKDWRREEKGMTEDEIVEWHHRHNGHAFEQAPGVGDGQGRLACCRPWVTKNQTNMTEQLNWKLSTLIPLPFPISDYDGNNNCIDLHFKTFNPLGLLSKLKSLWGSQWLLQGAFPNFLAWPTKWSSTQLSIEFLSSCPSSAPNTCPHNWQEMSISHRGNNSHFVAPSQNRHQKTEVLLFIN